MCDICGLCFSGSKILRMYRHHHSGEKAFTCKVCDNRFSTSSSVKIHMRQHTGERPYKCRMCSDCFSTPEILKMLVRRHTGEMPYKCDICGKRFISTQGVRLHSLGRPLEKNELCKYLFAANIRKHARRRLTCVTFVDILRTIRVLKNKLLQTLKRISHALFVGKVSFFKSSGKSFTLSYRRKAV